VRLEPFGFFQSLGDMDLITTVDLKTYAWRSQYCAANPISAAARSSTGRAP